MLSELNSCNELVCGFADSSAWILHPSIDSSTKKVDPTRRPFSVTNTVTPTSSTAHLQQDSAKRTRFHNDGPSSEDDDMGSEGEIYFFREPKPLQILI